jgi:hypothetical protein
MDTEVEKKIQLYPALAQTKFHELRSLVFAVAGENSISPIEETLKWGQPSYISKSGSTIRIDWSPKTPQNIYVFFNCKTTLVETFKEIFFDDFKFQTNRAIVLELDELLPHELKTCFLMALNYHRLKKLPLLGA